MTKSHYPVVFDKHELDFIYKLCTMSPYVNRNSDYKRKANATKISLSNDLVINAWASGSNPYEIQINRGLCNIFTFIGIAIAEFRKTNDTEDLIRACNWAGEQARKHNYKFESSLIETGIAYMDYNLTDPLLSDAGSYFTGMVLSVVGHELGHICSGHTLNDSVSNQTSKNDERTADLFAQSIISSTPFAGYLILSSLFVEVVFSWMSPDEANSPATTHPYSRERVYNVVTANDEYLESMGITKDNIVEFLP